MIVIICILGGLLLCSFFVIATLWTAINKIIDEYIENNPKTFMKYYFDHQTEEKFLCTLLLTIQEGADFYGSVYDFSQYEEKNIIGLIGYTKETTEYNDNEEPKLALIPNQVVCKMKDGSFQWDFRGLI